jgi:mRNA interferase RelE/StbE
VWLEKHIEGSNDPRISGKGLTGDKSGQWRYRVGKYRILSVIHDEIVIVEVIRVDKREVVYDD